MFSAASADERVIRRIRNDHVYGRLVAVATLPADYMDDHRVRSDDTRGFRNGVSRVVPREYYQPHAYARSDARSWRRKPKCIADRPWFTINQPGHAVVHDCFGCRLARGVRAVRDRYVPRIGSRGNGAVGIVSVHGMDGDVRGLYVLQSQKKPKCVTTLVALDTIDTTIKRGEP